MSRISKERKRRSGPKDAVCGWTLTIIRPVSRYRSREKKHVFYFFQQFLKKVESLSIFLTLENFVLRAGSE
jgi:hypothetical protein